MKALLILLIITVTGCTQVSEIDNLHHCVDSADVKIFDTTATTQSPDSAKPLKIKPKK